jgi:phage/plasmid-associated DNA primase/DNA repair photolyase
VEIPDQLKNRGLRFTRLRPAILGDKNSGKGPIDKGFYDEGALREDDPSLSSHLEAGLGFGLVCNYGGFIGFDADQGELLEGMGVMSRLPATLTDTAPNKPESQHFYYICKGLPQTFHFWHPSILAPEEEDEEGKIQPRKRLELGQICAGRGHITGPGAPHWSGGRREIIDDSPLAEITVDDLKAILEGVVFSEDPTKTPTFEEGAGLVDTSAWDDLRAKEKEARNARRGRGDDLSLSERIGDIRRVLRAYAWSPTTTSGDEWKGDVPGEFSKSKTALSVNVSEGLWYCHHHEGSGGDAAALVALFEGLIDCRGKDHLRDSTVFQAVIKACEEKGLIPSEERTDRAGAAPTSATGAAPFQLSDFGKWKRTEKKVKNPETGKTDTKIGFTFNFSRAKAAGSIREKMTLAMDSTAKDLYYFDGEIYEPLGGPKISSTLYNVGGDHVNRYIVGEVLDRVRTDLQLDPVKWNPDPCLMPLQNGVLELKTGAFRDYRPSDLLTFKYGAKWDPEGGDWMEFIWFLCTSLPDPRDVLTAIDIATAVALRIPFEIIVQLFGGGSNGKGIFEKVLLALFTQERSTALELEELKRSRFGPGALFDVDLWIISEVEGVKDAVSALKKIATGEFTDSDTKYGGRRKGRPHAVPILDSNHAFDYGDDSYGRKRRTAKLDFCYTFGDEPGMRPIDRDLKDKLTRPEALAGITQIIAARAPGLLRDKKIYRRKSTEEAEEEYRRQQYSLSYFCDECLGNTPPPSGDKLTVTVAYDEYLDYCKRFKVPTPASKISLGKYISKVFGVTSSNTKVNGEDVRVYGGVYLTKQPSEAFADHANHFYSDTSDRSATDKRQKNRYEITISNYLATEATENLLYRVLEEICRIYCFLESCSGDERSITRENYLEKSVASVASVAEGRSVTFFVATEERQKVNHLSPKPEISVAGERELAGEIADSSDDHQSIAANLEEDKRRKAEIAEKFKTPEPKPKLYGLTYSSGPAGEYSELSVNLYDGCTHRCDYCYNKTNQRRWNGTYGDPFRRIKKSSLPAIDRDIRTLEAAGVSGPVHLTFIGDAYDLGRDEDDVRAVLELFHKSKVNFQVLTKGGMKAARDFDLYRPGDSFACTLTFVDPETSKTLEPGAALPEDRLQALEEAHKKGIETWASLEPVIDPAETLELIRRSHKFVDHFKVGKWNHDKRAAGIDWRQFTADVVELLDSFGCDYYIKEDLRRYLPAERDRTKKEGERSPPKKIDPEENGRIFNLSQAYWRDLARQHNGLNTRVLKSELGYDDLKAGMCLDLLRKSGWIEDYLGRLQPPGYSDDEEVIS